MPRKRTPSGSKTQTRTSLIRCHETSLVVVIRFAVADDAVFVIKSVRGRAHAVAAIKRVVLAFMEQRAVSTEVVGEPLIGNIASIINVTGHRLHRARNVNRLVGLAVVQRRFTVAR